MNVRDHTSIDYGPMHADEFDRLELLLGQALLFQPGGMRDWLTSIGHAHVRSVRIGGAPAAGLAIIPMGHWFGGAKVRAAGITAVGVAPQYRGSGLGLSMLRRMLEEVHASGYPISTLYPATVTFYRRAGYERAATRVIYEAPLEVLNVRSDGVELVEVGLEAYDQLRAIYDQRARRSSGFIDRPDLLWSRVAEPKDKVAHRYIVRRDGRNEGYVLFTLGTYGEPLQVRDICALSAAAARRLMGLLAAHRSVLETARWNSGPRDPIVFLLAEQRHKVAWSGDLMLRIVDVPAALAARGYAPGVDAELHFAVHDELLPWNEGRFVLRVADGRGQVELGGQGRIDLHVRDLAALYTGYMTPAELRVAGALEGPAADLALAGLVFAGPQPGLPDMF